MTKEKYTEKYGQILIIDIETVSNLDMVQYIPEPDTPGNYKDPAKIEAYQEKAKAKLIEKMALDIDYAQLRCIGTGVHFSGKPEITLIHNKQEEKQALRDFWDLAHGFFLFGGYNLRGFDFPLLIRRSWALNILPCRRFNLTRNSKEIIDFMQLLYHEGYGPCSQKYRGLSAVCKMYGIHNPLPDVDGSMVAGMSDEELLKYNANDIKLTQEVARRTEGYYWGELPVYKKETVNVF